MVREETKGRLRKRVVWANVPSLRFSFRGNIPMYPRSGKVGLYTTSVKVLLFRGILRHTTPHFIAYFVFLLMWGVGVVDIVFTGCCWMTGGALRLCLASRSVPDLFHIPEEWLLAISLTIGAFQGVMGSLLVPYLADRSSMFGHPKKYTPKYNFLGFQNFGRGVFFGVFWKFQFGLTALCSRSGRSQTLHDIYRLVASQPGGQG